MKELKMLFAVLLAVIITTSMYSCGSDDDGDDSVSLKNVTLVAGEEMTIENGSGVTWVSDNVYIASVSGTTITAKRVGTAKISSSKGSFTVTVTGSSDLYDEPYMVWGSSVSTVNSYMSSYTLTKQTESILMYEGKKGADYILYGFENSKLTSSAAAIPSYYAKELVEFLNERYVYLSEEDNNYYFLSPDKKIIVVMDVEKINSSYYYFVFYTEYTGSSSSSSAKLSTFDLLPESRGLNASDNSEIKKLNDEIVSRFK